jgi:hypothetical protein
MRVTCAAAVVAFVAVSLSACGPGSKSADTSNAISAGTPPAAASISAGGAGSAAIDCNYISAAQLGGIEGATYAAPTDFNRMCTWAGSNGDSVTITVTRDATDADWQSALAGIQADQASGAPTPIAGVGDKAAGVGKEIAVLRGNTVIDIREADSPGFGKWPKSTAVANIIIAGLH